MEKTKILLIHSFILLILIIIIVSIKQSLFTQNLKLGPQPISVKFLGFGSNSSDAKLTEVLFAQGVQDAIPDMSAEFYLIHVNGSNVENINFGTTTTRDVNRSYCPGGGPFPLPCTYIHDHYVSYSNISTPTISCNNGDIIFTVDLAGITSYNIVVTNNSPASINIDNNNIITINTAGQTGGFEVKYVHNLKNNNSYPPGTIDFQFPGDGGASWAWVDHIHLGLSQNHDILFTEDGQSSGEHRYMFPGQYGFDINNPNIYLQYRMYDSGVEYNGADQDVSDWVNQQIKAGYRSFYITENMRGGWTCPSSWQSWLHAKNNINPSIGEISVRTSSSHCT